MLFKMVVGYVFLTSCKYRCNKQKGHDLIRKIYILLDKMDNFIHLNHLHVFKRCIDCDEVRENLKNLSRTLKETSIAEVVIAEADCCIETDLCDTLDRKTKCINDEISEGMWSMKFSQYVIHLNFSTTHIFNYAI